MGGAPLVSVLIPTVNHGPTLRWSVGSALSQELEAGIEVLIVGDGMSAETAAIAADLAAGDARVRVLEFPKGRRHGEEHRHAAVAREARGPVVLYLSDDDLWLPGHAAAMVAALESADFAAATAATVMPEGWMFVAPHDLALSGFHELMVRADPPWNHVPLSAAGHTRAAYGRLDVGWSPGPEGIPTDLFFYRQFLAADWITVASVSEPTCLVFPSPGRAGVSASRRAKELGDWAGRLAEPEGRARIAAQIEHAYRVQAVHGTLRFEQARRRAEAAEAELEGLRRHVSNIEATRSWRVYERVRTSAAGRWALGVRQRLRGR